MNGMSIAGQGYLPTVTNPDWQMVSFADVDGDGKADILWRNTANGQDYVWLMDGLNVPIAGRAYLPTVADSGWGVKGR